MDSYSLALEFVKIGAFMAVLCTAAYLIVRVFRKRRLPGSSGRELKVLDVLGLGGSRYLCVVEFGRKRVLVGVTDHCISRVATLRGASRTRASTWGRKEGSGPGTGVRSAKPEGPGSSRGTVQEAAFSQRLREAFIRSWSRLRGKNLWVLLVAVLLGITVLPREARCQPAPTDNLPIPRIDIRIGGEGGGGGLLSALGILALLTVLSLAPAILILTTSFTRIVVVFSFLRAGLGTQQTPANQILIGLALLMTFLIMSPVWNQVYDQAVQPYVQGQIDGVTAWQRGIVPVRDFMLRQTRQKDLALFLEFQGGNPPATPEDLSVFVVAPAFVISELKTAFEIGFMLFLPFLVIDMIVASTLMSMGMLMLPPVLISLPFKILLFVLVDGWGLLAQSLMKSFR